MIYNVEVKHTFVSVVQVEAEDTAEALEKAYSSSNSIDGVGGKTESLTILFDKSVEEIRDEYSDSSYRLSHIGA